MTYTKKIITKFDQANSLIIKNDTSLLIFILGEMKFIEFASICYCAYGSCGLNVCFAIYFGFARYSAICYGKNTDINCY